MQERLLLVFESIIFMHYVDVYYIISMYMIRTCIGHVYLYIHIYMCARLIRSTCCIETPPIIPRRLVQIPSPTGCQAWPSCDMCYRHGGSINPFPPKLPIPELSTLLSYAGRQGPVAKRSTSSRHNPALVPLLTCTHL